MGKLRLKENVFIVDGCRTPFSNPFKSLKEFTAVDLGSMAVKSLIRRNKISRKDVAEVILGNTVAAGIGQNFARQVALKAGLLESTLSYTINNVCGAGMQSVLLATQSVLAHDADLCIAGGAESATHSPYILRKSNDPSESSQERIESLMFDGLYCNIVGKNMGELAQELAKRHRISREDQDQFALESHQKAIQAQSNEALREEIISIKTKDRKQLQRDDRVRQKISMENFERLPPSFSAKGNVTAGNSSVPCDGAAALLIASQEYVENRNLNPKARIMGYSSIMTKPQKNFEGTLDAVDSCLDACGLSLDQIDLFEIGESFASQMVLLKKKLNIPSEKLNISGGDIALGHPLGAAGARCLITLIHSLRRKNLKTGLAGIAYGGGGAIAVVVERV